MAIVLTPLQTMAAARIIARTKVPYFTAAILALVPREFPGLGTMAVTARGQLMWDPEWTGKHSPEQIAWVLVHEVQHLILDHDTRRKGLGILDDDAEKLERWNIAGDAEINDGIREMGGKLPDGCIYPERFGANAGGIAEVYYNMLRQLASGGGSGGSAGEKPDAGCGWCGSGAGRPVPQEPKDGSAISGGQRSPADLERVRRQVAEAIRDHVASKGRGSVPLGIQVWADQLCKPPKVPWRQLLARAIRAAGAYCAGSVDYSYSRSNRRQGAIGWGRGNPILPTLRAPKPRVAVAVDTSGSMGPDEITRAASEIAGILRSTQSEILFLACDAAVHEVQRLKNVAQLAGALRGGGGTSFVPIFEAIGEMRDAPNTLIVITDGDGDAPAACPPNISRVIWVLVGSRRHHPTFAGGGEFGTFIEVDEEAA